jgi:hypothetical protein
MSKHLACGFLLLASGLFASGCCLTNQGVCDVGFDCDSCGPTGYETCGECQPGGCHHPWLWGRARSALTCDAGCGDVYTGEWASDPPSCGGPWQGSCGSAGCGDCFGFWNPLRGLAHLWGYRYAPAGYGMEYEMGYEEGCDSCAESYDMYDTMEPVEEVYEETLPAPKPDIEPDAEPETSKQASVRRPVRTVKHVPASHKTTAIRRR